MRLSWILEDRVTVDPLAEDWMDSMRSLRCASIGIGFFLFDATESRQDGFQAVAPTPRKPSLALNLLLALEWAGVSRTAQCTRGVRFGPWSSSPQDSWAILATLRNRSLFHIKSDGQELPDQ